MESCPPSGLDRLERWARILSLAAIPVVLGIIGFALDATFKDRNIDRDYVNIALKILRSPPPEKPDGSDRLLRTWAVSLLEESSPVPLPEGLREAILEGAVKLPVSADRDSTLTASQIAAVTRSSLLGVDILNKALTVINISLRENPDKESQRNLLRMIPQLERRRASLSTRYLAVISGAVTDVHVPSGSELDKLEALSLEADSFEVSDPAQTIAYVERVLARLDELGL
jgi:hypothetical protein